LLLNNLARYFGKERESKFFEFEQGCGLTRSRSARKDEKILVYVHVTFFCQVLVEQF
jgi:hypothetical protein